ncbi:MAG: GNAT family N-acetyltransferase [Geminicoccaceae bacterium]
MSQPVDDIKIADDTPNVGDDIETQLLCTLQETLPQACNSNFVLSARDRQGRLVGGLAANTAYGWLLIKALWVASSHRNRGIGRALIERAEVKAGKIGCHGAWLDTSNPKAKAFYAQLGYSTFGRLANSIGQQPAGHCRWFMKKPL